MNKKDMIGTVLTQEQTGLWYIGQEGFVIGKNNLIIDDEDPVKHGFLLR